MLTWQLSRKYTKGNSYFFCFPLVVSTSVSCSSKVAFCWLISTCKLIFPASLDSARIISFGKKSFFAVTVCFKIWRSIFTELDFTRQQTSPKWQREILSTSERTEVSSCVISSLQLVSWTSFALDLAWIYFLAKKMLRLRQEHHRNIYIFLISS